MATRSTIALEHADGTVSQVYCHWDGYLSGLGRELELKYSDPVELKELIDGGDMSSPGEPYTARGEELNIRRFKNFNEYRHEGQQEEYDYILRPVKGEYVWFVRCYATGSAWVTMEQADEAEQECF